MGTNSFLFLSDFSLLSLSFSFYLFLRHPFSVSSFLNSSPIFLFPSTELITSACYWAITRRGEIQRKRKKEKEKGRKKETKGKRGEKETGKSCGLWWELKVVQSPRLVIRDFVDWIGNESESIFMNFLPSFPSLSDQLQMKEMEGKKLRKKDSLRDGQRKRRKLRIVSKRDHLPSLHRSKWMSSFPQSGSFFISFTW